jgi:formate/nitrite transporter FocA (FNT family)
MVWLIPNAKSAEFHVITLVTYLIAIVGSAHIIVGSVEAFMRVLAGSLGVGAMIVRFVVPVFIGNVIGGTVLFALISYAQVMEEI